MRLPDFNPPVALRNPHVQSLLSSSFLRKRMLLRGRPAVFEAARREVIECGAGVRLEAWRSSQADAAGTVVLYHGWEGSVRSNYMLDTAIRLFDMGFEVVRLNFRDHGDTHHLNRELFHSCRLAEVVAATEAIGRAAAPRPLALVGHSLGGNFALRVANAADFPIAHAFAVSPVISPSAGLAAIETAPGFYEGYFMRKWRRSLAKKREIYPEDYPWEPVLDTANLRELTAWLVDRYTGFEDLDAYLNGYSIAGDRLAGLSVPATLITAQDDPVIPIEDFRQLALPGHAELQVTRYGGHCGFMENLSLTSWASRVITGALRDLLAGGGDREAARADSGIMEPS